MRAALTNIWQKGLLGGGLKPVYGSESAVSVVARTRGDTQASVVLFFSAWSAKRNHAAAMLTMESLALESVKVSVTWRNCDARWRYCSGAMHVPDRGRRPGIGNVPYQRQMATATGV